jgi:hypothetical protein
MKMVKLYSKLELASFASLVERLQFLFVAMGKHLKMLDVDVAL